MSVFYLSVLSIFLFCFYAPGVSLRGGPVMACFVTHANFGISCLWRPWSVDFLDLLELSRSVFSIFFCKSQVLSWGRGKGECFLFREICDKISRAFKASTYIYLGFWLTKQNTVSRVRLDQWLIRSNGYLGHIIDSVERDTVQKDILSELYTRNFPKIQQPAQNFVPPLDRPVLLHTPLQGWCLADDGSDVPVAVIGEH